MVPHRRRNGRILLWGVLASAGRWCPAFRVDGIHLARLGLRHHPSFPIDLPMMIVEKAAEAL
jgi:hypothetical protein